MGMARHAPLDQYKMHFQILPAVVSYLRQVMPDLNHRPDEDLSRFIDRAAWEGIQNGAVEAATGVEGRPIRLVTMPDRVPKKLTALLAPNTGRLAKLYPEVLLMLFTEEELARRKASGEITDHKASPGKPMVSLATKFPSDIAARVVVKPENPMPPASKATPPPKQRFRINWLDEHGNGVDEYFEDRNEFVERLQELVDEGGTDELRTYKEVLVPTWVELKTRVKVEIDE